MSYLPTTAEIFHRHTNFMEVIHENNFSELYPLLVQYFLPKLLSYASIYHLQCIYHKVDRQYSQFISNCLWLQDYHHELVCVTEREKFIVPVHCVGARAILDFPDEVNFPTGPVKYASSRTLLVRNIGEKDAKFNLVTERYIRAFLN